MNGMLLEYASGEHAELADLQQNWNDGWCQLHGLEHLVEKDPSLADGRAAAWGKIALLLREMTAHPECPVFVVKDTDAVCVYRAVNPLNALPEVFDLALFGWNSGFMVVRNNEASRAFFQSVWDKHFVVELYRGVDHRLRTELDGTSLHVCSLGSRWNYFDKYGERGMAQKVDCKRSEAVIVHWAGYQLSRAKFEIYNVVRAR